MGPVATFSSSLSGASALTKAVPFNPFVSAETLKACALIGLHLLAAEDEAGSSGGQFPDLRDMWRHGCPKSPDWDSDVEAWTESEGTSSSEQCEHSVVWGKTSQVKGFLFLEDWELAKVTLSWMCCARKCLRVVRLPLPKSPHSKESLSLTVDGLSQ